MGSGIIIYLFIGLIGMIVISFLRKKLYVLKTSEIFISMVLLLIFGVLGTMILYRIESGEWGGTSFFGSILLVPVLFVPVTKLMKIPYGKMMDFCAVPICVMLAVMKVRCVTGPCCVGRIMYEDSYGRLLIFPSQIVEGIVIILVMIALIWLERQQMPTGKIYPLFLILYGATRFVLNFFRAELSPFVWILPPGHFWAIVSVGLGCAIIYRINKKEKQSEV